MKPNILPLSKTDILLPIILQNSCFSPRLIPPLFGPTWRGCATGGLTDVFKAHPKIARNSPKK
jgi:hypothetical protein